MPAGRCFACEWFGYYRRWIWLEVLLNVAVLFALVLVLVFRGSWIAYAVGLPLILWLFNARLLSPFDAFKRKLFLAERFAGRWYEYAIPLRRGKLKARAERLSSR
jgi:hypothetical protein